jgi:bacterioferritin
MPKPVNVSEPYPTPDGVCPDALSLRIISPAYAAPHSELNSILQYIYHAMFFERNGYKDFADTITGIAISEMHHLDLLGSTILALGAAPVFSQFPPGCFNFYSSKFVAYSSSLKNMLEDDVLAERQAIAGYERMLKCLKNQQVKSIIARILLDEKLHFEKFEEMLKELKC